MNQNDDMIQSKHKRNQDSYIKENTNNQSIYDNQYSDSQDNYQLIPRQHYIHKPLIDKPLQYNSKPYIYQQSSYYHNHQELVPRYQQLKQIRLDKPVQYSSKPFKFTLLNEKQKQIQVQIQNQKQKKNQKQIQKQKQIKRINKQIQRINEQINKNSKSQYQQQQQIQNNDNYNNIQTQYNQICIQQTHIVSQQTIRSSQTSNKDHVNKNIYQLKMKQVQSQQQNQFLKQYPQNKQKTIKQHQQYSKLQHLHTNQHPQYNILQHQHNKQHQHINKLQQKQSIKQSIKQSSQSNQSIVSKSSQQQNQINKQYNSLKQIKSIQHNNQSYINQYNQFIKKQNLHQPIQSFHNIINKQSSNQLLFQQSSNNILSKFKSFDSQYSSTHQVISIEGSQPQDQVQQILYKYHFQTQSNFSFTPNQISKQPKSDPDPYQKYKKSAEYSPIIQNKESYISIQKHTGYQKYIQQQKEQLSKKSKSNINNQVQYLATPSINQDENQTSQHKLIKSLKQIDNLRRDLVKSTQNNINAIFNTNLTAQQCHLTQMIQGIQTKVGHLYQKVQKIQQKRIKQMQYEIIEVRRRQRQRQLINQRQERNRRSYGNNESGNMILDLGKGNANQGKIIAIYPNNKMVSVKQLMFGQQNQDTKHLQKQKQKQKQTNMKMMLEMQQQFLKTLHKFQEEVNFSIQKKLQQVKNFQQKQQKIKYENIQKIQRVSQQTNDHDQEYDDSRGSINVIYIRKLRQLEDNVKQKQWKIQRLEKQNYYLQKQLNKLEQVGINETKLKKSLSPVKKLQNNYFMNQQLDFKKNYQNDSNIYSLLNPSFQNNSLFSFSKSPFQSFQPFDVINARSISSSSQKNQQRIKQPVTLTNQQINSFNSYTKKKNTHSFHYYESKNLQGIQLNELKEKLSQYELVLKEKDLRIRELQNTIMDHLESSQRWKKQISEKSEKSGQSQNSQRISGYQSVNSKQLNSEVLHMKINNLKTLLKQSKKQVDKYKKLYQDEKSSTLKPTSHQNICCQIKNREDFSTNTSKSMCISQKTTVRNQKNIVQIKETNKSPFAEITQKQTTIQKSRQLSDIQNPTMHLTSDQQIIIVNGLVNFILMAWSLKEVITKLCGKQVNVQKINRNASQFLSEIKHKQLRMWNKINQKLKQNNFASNMKQIWLQ